MTAHTEVLRQAREALIKMLSNQGNIEVLGEWSALDMNIKSGKRLRAKVDADTIVARSALAAIDAALAQPPQDERAAFESWWKRTEHAIVQMPYAHITAWEAWQAAKEST
jgi:hypothetical protein